jgi:two-component system chemotaxis response regulator CheY
MNENDYSVVRVNGTLPDPCTIDTDEIVRDLWPAYDDSISSILPELEKVALDYEAGKNVDENAASIRRILHSMKGEAGMCGVMDIYHLCHEAEFGFEELKDHSEAGDMVLKVKDWIEAAVTHLTKNGLPKQTTTQKDSSSNSNSDDKYSEEGQDRRRNNDRRETTNDRRVGRWSDGTKIKTLVIDDSDVCRKMVDILLKDYCDCEFACDGLEGFELFKRDLHSDEPFRLITLDIQMPKMDGHETLEAIRKYESENGIYGLDGVKIIMTTSQEEREHVFGAFRKGCEAYVIKPMGEKLLAEMNRLSLLKIQKQYSVV